MHEMSTMKCFILGFRREDLVVNGTIGGAPAVEEATSVRLATSRLVRIQWRLRTHDFGFTSLMNSLVM